MGKKVKGWVPPSDAVEVAEASSWSPPSDALETEKKTSVLPNSPAQPKLSQNPLEVYQDPEILKAQNKQQGIHTLENGLTEEQDKQKTLNELQGNQQPTDNLRSALYSLPENGKMAGFIYDVGKKVTSMVRHDFPAMYHENEAANNYTSEEDFKNHLQLTGDPKKLLDYQILANGEGDVNIKKDHPEFTSEYQKFKDSTTEERVQHLKKAQYYHEESAKFLADVPKTWKEATASKNGVTSYIANAIGQGISQIPLGIASFGSSSFYMERGDAYHEAVDAIAKENKTTSEEIIKSGNDEPARKIGDVVGLINGSLDAISLGGILSTFKGAAKKTIIDIAKKEIQQTVLKKVVSQGAHITVATAGEMGTEWAQENNTQLGALYAAKGQGKSFDDFIHSDVNFNDLSKGGDIDYTRNNEAALQALFSTGPLAVGGKILSNESGGNKTTKTTDNPLQRNEEQPNEQGNQTPVQPSANEAGQTPATGPASVLENGKTKVFVYGTLKNPETRKEAIDEHISTTENETKGSVENLGDGYTTLNSGDENIKGQVMEVTPDQLSKLDKWESKYNRKEITLSDGTKAQAYILKENSKLQSDGKSTTSENRGNEIDSVSRGTEQKDNGISQEAAENITRKLQEASPTTQGTQRSERQLKKEQDNELEAYARKTGSFIDDPKETFGEKIDGGTEQDVYLNKEEDKVIKVNGLSNHSSWSEFWDRLNLQNKLFPNEGYKLIGFTKSGGRLSAVSEQPYVEGTPVPRQELIDNLATKGFFQIHPEGSPGQNQFYNPELGVRLSDVHGENVIKDADGNIRYIDPMLDRENPFVDEESKQHFNDQKAKYLESQNPEASKEGENLNQPTDGKVNEKGWQEGEQNVLTKPEEVAKNEQPLSKNATVNPEAEQLLNNIDNGIPAFMTDNIKRIAKENGIVVDENTKPQDVIDQLKEKRNGPVSNQSEQQVSEPTGTEQSIDETNPPPPVGEGTANEAGEGKKERTIGKRYLNDPEVSNELKSGLSEEGQYYIPTTDLKRQADADAYIEAKGIDQAMNDITDPKNGMSDDNRVFIGKTIYKMLKEEVKTSEKPDAVRDKINRLVEDVAKMGTKAGQTVQAFANMFTSDAEQVAHALKREYESTRTEALENAQPRLQNLQSLIDQATDEALKGLLNDPRIKKLIEESNLTSKSRQSKRKQFTQKVLSRLDELEKQIDDSMKSGQLRADLTFGLAPLAYKAAINIIRVAVKAGDSFIDAVEKAVQEISKENKNWDEAGFRKQFEDEVKQEQKNDRKTLYQALKESGEDFKKLAEEHYKSYANKKSDILSVLEEKFNLDPKEAERLVNTLDKIIGEKRKKLIEQKFAPKIATPKKKKITKQLADKIKEMTDLGVMSEKKVRDAYLESIGLPAMSEEQAKQMEKLVEKAESKPEGFQRFEAVQDMIKYHQGITPVSWLSVGEAIWYANMLSGLSTHKINFEANAVRTLTETFVSTIQAIAEYKNPKVALKNTAFMLRGLVDGYKRYLAESANILKNGYSPTRGKFDSNMFSGVKTSQPSVLETLDTKNPLHLWKYIGRLMTASDILFYGGLKHMRAHQLSFRDAYNENQNTFDKNTLTRANEYLGKTDIKLQTAKDQAESEGLTGRNYNRRVSEILEQTWKEQNREDTNSFAAKGTYNYDPEGVMGLAVGVVNHMTQKIPLLKTVVPFSRVIANVTNDYLDYTPWGLVRADVKKGMGIPNKPSYKRFTPEERLRERIKAVAGTTAMITLYALSQPGDDGEEPYLEISSDGTGNFKNNFELGRTGWKEYTAKVKGSDVRFDYRNTQLAIPFAVIGYLNDAKKYKNLKVDDNQLGLIFSGTFHFISDLSFLSGLSDFFEILTDEKEIGQKLVKFGERTAKTVIVPNAFTQVSRSIQEITETPMKKGDTFYGQLFRDFPVLRDSKGDMYNTLGEPIVTETLYKFNPMKMSTMADEKDKDSYKLWQMIVDNKAWIGSPSKATMVYDPTTGIERQLTDDEYDKFALQAAKYTKEMLLMDYDNLAKETDAKRIKDRIYDIKENARSRAKNELFFMELN